MRTCTTCKQKYETGFIGMVGQAILPDSYTNWSGSRELTTSALLYPASRRGKRWPSGIISAMSAQPPPKSFASLLWDIIRLGVRALWENRANPARTLLERQQALALLGLPPNATRQQIKRRYRSLAKRYHPDRGGDQQQMRRIIAAYELLMRDQPKTQSE